MALCRSRAAESEYQRIRAPRPKGVRKAWGPWGPGPGSLKCRAWRSGRRPARLSPRGQRCSLCLQVVRWRVWKCEKWSGRFPKSRCDEGWLSPLLGCCRCSEVQFVEKKIPKPVIQYGCSDERPYVPVLLLSACWRSSAKVEKTVEVPHVAPA